MDRIQGTDKINYACDFMLAGRAMSNGVTPQVTKTRQKYWGHWETYTAKCNVSPFLDAVDNIERAILLTGYAARVRTGAFGRGNQVKIQSVTDALSSISTTAQLVGKQSPVHKAPGEYILPVKRCIEGFRRDDPPAQPQLAIPKEVAEECIRLGYLSQDVCLQAKGDLATVAFYYLLRNGEYTKPRKVELNGRRVPATRTRQFRVCDVGFFRDRKILPRRSPLEILIQADSATLKITNQKNGRMGQTLHQQSTGSSGAVAALCRRVHHIVSNGGSDNQLICDVRLPTGTWYSISQHDMVQTVRTATKSLKLHENGIDPDLIGAHSLRAGGAMSLKIMGYSDSTIQKIGRWTSDTWQMYIHTQISHLHQGIAASMTTAIPYHNIAFIEPPQAST